MVFSSIDLGRRLAWQAKVQVTVAFNVHKDA